MAFQFHMLTNNRSTKQGTRTGGLFDASRESGFSIFETALLPKYSKIPLADERSNDGAIQVSGQKGVKWMVKFNYSDPKTGKTKQSTKGALKASEKPENMRTNFLKTSPLIAVRKILFTNGHLKMFSTNTLCHTSEKILRIRHYKQNTIFLKSISSRLFGMC